MANNENLIRLSPNEAREYGRRGGKASGKARRRKADFRKVLNMLLTTEIDSEEWRPILEALGIECTLESALNMAMIKEGLAGNVKAYEAIAKYSGQASQTDADLEEQQIRIDRAKRARSQEVGDISGAEDNIQSFLRAMNPTQEEMDALFDVDEGVEVDAKETEETSEV